MKTKGFRRFLELELLFNFVILTITHTNQGEAINWLQSIGNTVISILFASNPPPELHQCFLALTHQIRRESRFQCLSRGNEGQLSVFHLPAK